jgi:hypothetical protein
MSATTLVPEEVERKFDRKLWVSMLGGPVLWLIYLQTAYVLVQPACTSGEKSVLHITSAFFLGLTIAMGVISLGQWTQVGRGWPSEEEEAHSGRQRSMAMIGILQSGLFGLLIITSWAAISILNPCEGVSWP